MMDYKRIYMYSDFVDVVAVEADSKEEACKKMKEALGDAVYGITPEDIKTLDEFIEQFLVED